MTGRARQTGTFEVDCTVRVTCTAEELSAHVELDGVDIAPGDRVIVHGPAPEARFGERIVERRRATVRRASWLERLWVRLTGDLECFELIETSFTDRRASS